MKLVADENLEALDVFFSSEELQTLPGRQISHQDVMEADGLFVRSVTRVNRELIEGTPVQFVGSATIGTDHLDLTALNGLGISVAHAPGCNAQAVAEYVMTALLTLRPELIHAADGFTLGIIGMGNVGKRLQMLARAFGWRVLASDPLLPMNAWPEGVCSTTLETVLSQADAISLHVPLTKNGSAPTYHLLNQHTLALLKPNAIVINTARGPVISESELMQSLHTDPRPVVLDVFEHEPRISAELLSAITIATPHIAGYSLEGKVRGTQMIYQAWCQWKQQLPDTELTGEAALQNLLPSVPPLIAPNEVPHLETLLNAMLRAYPIMRDDAALRATVSDGEVQGESFDRLRKQYPLRREWSALGIRIAEVFSGLKPAF